MRKVQWHYVQDGGHIFKYEVRPTKFGLFPQDGCHTLDITIATKYARTRTTQWCAMNTC